MLYDILTFVGGTSILVAALAWLTKSIVTHLLSKDIEQYKTTLRAQNDVEIERLRAALARESLEHEIRFRRIDERIAEHTAEIYTRLFTLYETASRYVAILEFSDEPSKEEKLVAVVNANGAFWDYFLPNRLYVPPTLFKRIRSVADKLARVVGDFREGYSREQQGRRPAGEDYWLEAVKKFESDVTPLFTELVREFQERLGVRDLDDLTANGDALQIPPDAEECG